MDDNRLFTGLTAFFVALLAWALPAANLYAFFLALIPATALLAGLKGRSRVQIKVHAPTLPLHVGQQFDIHVDYLVRGGSGLFQIYVPLPEELELEEGNNLHVVPKFMGKRRGRFTLRLQAHRRARYDLDDVEWSLLPFHRVAAPLTGHVPTKARLDIRPNLVNFKKVPGAKVLAKDFQPQGAKASMGSTTTDFRDLREYRQGDRMRAINWKATAKALASAPEGRGVPIVNDYEFEGTLGVWIFLDQGVEMKLGTNLDNCFERGMEAALGLSRFYLDRGMRVGFSAYNGPRSDPVLQLHPDHGSRQAFRIMQELHGREATDSRDGLADAVERALPFIRGGRTFVIVITRIEQMTAKDLAAMKALRNATVRRRGAPNMLAITPDMYGGLTLDAPLRAAAAETRRAMEETRAGAVRSLGIRTLRWKPDERPLHAHMLRGRR